MDKDIILGLIQNTAILLAFSMIYDYSWLPKRDSKKLTAKIITGFVIGSVGIILMLTPWKQLPGLVFDTRSVLLSLAGLFFGFVPTMVAVVIMGTYRLLLGGPGIWMGISVIITSAAAGLIWRYYRPNWMAKRYIAELALLGLSVHLLMLASVMFLPHDYKTTTLHNIAIPLLTIYPAGNVLLGLLMLRQLKNQENRDISRKLLDSEKRFIDLLKNFNYFSLILDRDGKIQFCNSKVVEASGIPAEQLIGKSAFEYLLPKGSAAAVRDAYDYILRGKTGFYSYETEFTKSDGNVLFVEWNATVLRDSDNYISSVAAIGQDITSRKQAEAELIRAKSQAEESDNLKSIFLSNMSHEIRTPMNAIMGFSSLLGMDDSTEEERLQYISIIQNSGDRLLKIINDIIDISKLDAKQLSMSLTECSLIEIFNNSTETFRKSDLLKEKKNITLKLAPNEKNTDIKLITDKHRFQQVLDNLISNSIKYTERGTIETGFSIVNENGTDMVRVYVKDTGIGIPDNMKDIIFERFRQIDENKYHEGAGLGLSITKGIIELLGGKIWFTSEPGKGSTFYFQIPLIVSETVRMPGRIEANQDPDLQGKTVIIAEDDYNSFYYLRLLLKNLNANILHAENGGVLMRLVKHKVPDLILLDINMPVKTGFECLQEINELGIKTAIIAQTAYAMSSEKERCLSEGCDGYIAKPVTKAELYREINAIFAAKQAADI